MTDALTDTNKFSIIVRMYASIYEGYEKFSEKITASRATIHNWEQCNTKTINGKAKSEICDIFNLQYTIWTDKFYDEINFEHSIQDYHKINKVVTINDEEVIAKKIVGEVKSISRDEATLLENLSQNKTIIVSTIELTNRTPIFLFEFAQLLKNKKQIKEALFILQLIDKTQGIYKYTYHNNIQHLKAILLSDDVLKKWDEAIHILRLLYSSSHYHLQEPEIITLMASNFKRKALSHKEEWIDKEHIDKELLFRAFSLYRDAYKIKDTKSRYYDAINIAYLNNIIDAIEPEFTEKQVIKELYKDLTREWKPEASTWWEVSSNAEFLMLIDKPKIAISEIEFFLESEKIEPFYIESTLRQLKMYLHFVDDENAKVFYDYLMKSWETLK